MATDATPTNPTYPVEHYLTLAEKFARDAREGFTISREMHEQAGKARVVAPSAADLRVLNGKQPVVGGANPQQQMAEAAKFEHSKAEANAGNLIQAVRKMAGMFGLRITVESADGRN